MNGCPASVSALPVYSGEPLYLDAAETLTLPRQANITTQRLILSAGAGAYVVTAILSDTNAQSGDIFRLILVFPASVNPSVQIEDSQVGSIADPITGTGYIFQSAVEATFNGVSWEIDEQSA